MVKVISQETFDAVVKENVEDFGMDMKEAIADAKEQFEKQGINLNNLVISEKGSQVVVESVQELFKDLSEDDLINHMKIIQGCCEQDLPQRVLATDNGAYSVLLKQIKTPSLRLEAVKTLSAIMDTNPDHLEAQGVALINNLLHDNPHGELAVAVLDWILNCCVRCEANREQFVVSGLLTRLASEARIEDKEIMLRVCRVWIALVQDDDIRVPFGKAHETARTIVENHDALKILTKSLTKFSSELDVLNICLSALANLAVRNEYCEEVVDEGGLIFLHDILVNNTEKAELVTRTLTLIKVLAGNDKVKGDVGKAGGIPLILAALDKHITKPGAVEAGCGALSAVTLRQPDNCKQVVDSNGASIITTAMDRHTKHSKVQGAAASAIRNIVSRNKELCQPFIDRDVEKLLNCALNQHGKRIGDTLRSALRDLGLKVELQEHWTGDKIKIKETFEESPEIQN